MAFTLGPMLGAFLTLEMAPWLSLLFAVSDLLFIFCFLPETLPLEKRVGLGLGVQFRGFEGTSPLVCASASANARCQAS